MELRTETVNDITVVTIAGDIDSSSAAGAQEQILPLAGPGIRLLLDLTDVGYMSSAGLRMLLSLYRRMLGQEGRVALVGLSEEIKDTMSVTGFLSFFTVCDNRADGLRELERTDGS